MTGVPDRDPDFEIAGLLHALLDEVRALRVSVGRRSASNRLTRADLQTLERFLPAVFAHTKGSIVLARELE